MHGAEQIPHGDGVGFHPSVLGMQAIATEVLATVRATRAAEAAAEAREAQRRALAAAARTVRLRVSCVKKRNRKVAVFRVDRGHGLIARVAFRVGRHSVGYDTGAPFRHLVKPRKALRRGKVQAQVVLKAGSQMRRVVLRTARPGCLRR